MGVCCATATHGVHSSSLPIDAPPRGRKASRQTRDLDALPHDRKEAATSAQTPVPVATSKTEPHDRKDQSGGATSTYRATSVGNAGPLPWGRNYGYPPDVSTDLFLISPLSSFSDASYRYCGDLMSHVEVSQLTHSVRYRQERQMPSDIDMTSEMDTSISLDRPMPGIGRRLSTRRLRDRQQYLIAAEAEMRSTVFRSCQADFDEIVVQHVTEMFAAEHHTMCHRFLLRQLHTYLQLTAALEQLSREHFVRWWWCSRPRLHCSAAAVVPAPIADATGSSDLLSMRQRKMVEVGTRYSASSDPELTSSEGTVEEDDGPLPVGNPSIASAPSPLRVNGDALENSREASSQSAPHLRRQLSYIHPASHAKAVRGTRTQKR